MIEKDTFAYWQRKCEEKLNHWNRRFEAAFSESGRTYDLATAQRVYQNRFKCGSRIAILTLVMSGIGLLITISVVTFPRSC